MASGLPPNIVDQLIEAERIPVKTMEKSKAVEEDKLKLVTDLETKVSEITKNVADLTGVKGFSNLKLVSGFPDIINGSVDPAVANTGEWEIEVLELANKPGAVSNGFPDKNETRLGVGYMKFQTPQGEKEIYVNKNNSTLEGLVKAINSAGVGLRANVVEDKKDPENPFRLQVTGMATGAGNQVTFPTIYLLDGDQDLQFEESREAKNAKIKLDGFEMEIDANQASTLIPGVSLDLKQAQPGRPIKISIKEDLEVIGGKIKSFVDAYNGALGFIQGQAKLQKGPDGKERLGPLGGDSLTRTVEGTLRRIITNPQYGGTVQRLNELGIEFNRNGTLNYNAEKFNKVLNSDPKGVAQFLQGDGFSTGFIPTLRRELSGLTASNTGPLANRKRGIQQKIDVVNQRIDNKERQLTRREETLRRTFSDLESKMSKLQSQGAAIGGGFGGLQQAKG